MIVALGSAFRNASGNIDAYLGRASDLRDRLRELRMGLRLIAAEGDSTDGTRQRLLDGAAGRSLDCAIAPCDHGGPMFGSSEAPERLAALSKVGNAIFDGVRQEDGLLVYVESDLSWDVPTIHGLMRNALDSEGGFDVFAPLIMAGDCFYDVWGFRDLQGERFSPFPPFSGAAVTGGLFEVSSVGSCLVMRAEVARRCRIEDDYALVGWCRAARAAGYRIAVRPDLKVRQA